MFTNLYLSVVTALMSKVFHLSNLKNVKFNQMLNSKKFVETSLYFVTQLSKSNLVLILTILLTIQFKIKINAHLLYNLVDKRF